jgi:hypothetical protein
MPCFDQFDPAPRIHDPMYSPRALQEDFVELAAAVSHQCIRPQIGACCTPGHHGCQHACVLISGQASICRAPSPQPSPTRGEGVSPSLPINRIFNPTAPLTRRHDPRSQRHQPLERNHHVVAGLQVKLGRVRLADRDAARRAHRDQVAGLEHHITRKVLQHV